MTHLPATLRPSPIAAEARLLLPLVAVVVAVLSLWPLGRILWTALAPSQTALGPVLEQLADRNVLLATWRTLESGVLSGLISVVLGTAVALTLSVTDVRGKRLFAFLFVMSMLLAPQVAALAFKTLAGPASPLLKAIGLAPPPGQGNPLVGRFGVVLVLGLHHAPLVMLTVLTGLKTLPNSLAEAAMVDGATGREVTQHVVLPALRPHLVAGGLLAFVAAAGNFGIPALLGMPAGYLTLPTLVYRQLSSFGPAVLANVAALSLLIALLAGAAVFGAERLLRGGAPTLERGQPLGIYWTLGAWRGLVEAGMWLLVGITLVVPLASLASTALVPAYGVPLTFQTITPRAFVEVLTRQAATLEAFRNSLAYSAASAIIVGLLAVPLAYALERQAGRARGVVLLLIEMPYALPGVVLAVACIVAFLRPLPIVGWHLYGTAAIIIFAYVARFLALALKPVGAAMRQLDMEIEEAAALCGAGLVDRLRFIVLPNLAAAAAAGMLFTFLTAFNELTVSALLWSAGTRTIGVVLYSLEDAGLASEASALGCISAAMVLVLMLVIDRLAGRLPPGTVPWRVD